MINSWLLVGPSNVLSLGTSLYEQLLLIKLAPFAAMVSLAAINRFRLTHTLGIARTSEDALRRLQVSLKLETIAAFAILGLVARLGTLEPPVAAM